MEQTPLEQLVIACYLDYLPEEVDDPIPPVVAESRRLFSKQNHYLWKDVLEAGEKPECTLGDADDLAVMPYTSGTTGLPKGCLHKHSSVQANTIGGAYWDILTPNSVCFTTLPLFHVTGMIHSMHMPIFVGAEMIVLTRWDREYARKIIKKKQISHWVVISTMLIDFLANPLLKKEDVASLELIAGGRSFAAGGRWGEAVQINGPSLCRRIWIIRNDFSYTFQSAGSPKIAMFRGSIVRC